MKTSKKDFEYFKQRCFYWQKELGLQCWEINFTHNKKYPDNRATTGYRLKAFNSTIHLNIDWQDDEISNEALDRSALHEVLHLMFAPLSIEAQEWLSDNYLRQYERPRKAL